MLTKEASSEITLYPTSEDASFVSMTKNNLIHF